MSKNIGKLLFAICIIFLKPEAFSQEKNNPEFKKPESYKEAELTYKIIKAANETWCYDILSDGKTLIHQTSIPGKAGIEGFKTEEQAAKVAKAVIEKIKQGIMPPSMTLEEIKLLGIY